MKGFFLKSTLVASKPSSSLLPKCGACGFYKHCATPKMAWTGLGRRGILIVGEWPTVNDDRTGKPFTGGIGSYLEDALLELGVNMERDCWLTNALICKPINTHKKNDKEVEFCRPNLLRTVRELQPNVIILLGSAAVQSYISEVWKASPGGINRWVGWQIPCQKPNVWICPMHHPSYLEQEGNAVLEMHWRKHLANAISKTSKPWDTIPDYESEIEVIMDTNEAARVLRKMKEKGGIIAGDYENNTLKPERKGSRIVCCSMCWEGKKTISYPWHGEAIKATGELWYAPNCQFVASNMKHEDRWTHKEFGPGTIRWFWDTMIAAHVIDNRPGICGLKFLAFVLLGAEAYDEAIKQFLEQKGDSHFNQVEHEVDLHQLLTYCGMDTLLEFLLMLAEMRIMGKRFK